MHLRAAPRRARWRARRICDPSAQAARAATNHCARRRARPLPRRSGNAPMPAPKMDAAMPRTFLPALNFGGGATAGSVRRVVSVPPRARHLRPAGAPAQAGAGPAAALRDGHQLGHLACRFPVLEALAPHQCVLPAGRREQKIPKLFERDRARLGVVINVIPSVRHLPTPVLRSGFWQVMYDPRLWIGAGSSPYAVPGFGECRLN